MGPRGPDPAPYVVAAPVAGGEENIPSGGPQGHAHTAVQQLAVDARGLVAEVVLQIVHAPARKGFRVQELVVKGPGIIRAGALSGAGIHPEFQPLCVNVICHGLHALGEFGGFRLQLIRFRVPDLFAPAVIDDDVLVARVLQPQLHKSVGALPDQLVRDFMSEGIPGIPSHGWPVDKHMHPPLSFPSLFEHILSVSKCIRAGCVCQP